MDELSSVVGLLYQYADSVALLALTALGLIIIFGLMGVINMAHGEMMMIGAYITSFSYYAGIPVVLAIILGGLGAAGVGIVLERLIVRRFYGHLLSSLVATWGLSLVLSQGALLVFGPQIKTVPTPFGSFAVGELSFSMPNTRNTWPRSCTRLLCWPVPAGIWRPRSFRRKCRCRFNEFEG